MRVFISVFLVLISYTVWAQSEKLSLEQALESALKNNSGIKAAAFDIELQRQLKKTSFDLPKTNVSLLYGQYNSYAKNDNNLTITQAIPFTSLGSQGALNRALLASSERRKSVSENELIFQVKQVYYQIAYEQARQKLLLRQDSIYEGFFKASALRFKTGEANLLEKTTAEAQRNDVKNRLRQNESTILGWRTQLKTLLNSNGLPEISKASLDELVVQLPFDTAVVATNPSLALARQQVEVAKADKRFQSAKFAPDLLIGYFNQTLIDVVNTENGAIATGANRFTGFQVGLSIPLWFVPHQGRAKAADFGLRAAQSNLKNYHIGLTGLWQQAEQQYIKNKNSLEYYKTSALPNANLILQQSQIAFNQGEVGYVEYLLGVRNALTLQEAYLQTLNDYNQTVIYIEFLSGTK